MKTWLNEKNEFVSLNMEQIKSLSDEDKGLYIEAKELNLKTILDDFKAKNEGLKTEIDSLVENHKNEITELKEQLREIAENKKNNKMELQEKSVLEQLEEKRTEILEAFKNQDKKFTLEIKAPSTQTTTYTLSGRGDYQSTMMGITSLTTRPSIVLDALMKGGVSTDSAYWIEETLKEGSFAMTAEGGVKPLTSEKYEKFSTISKKTAGVKKMSEEQATDFKQLTAIILNNVKKDHDRALEDNVWGGDGTGENLSGVTLNATSLAVVAPFLNTVVAPNLKNAVVVANNQIKVSSDGEYKANAVLLHPSDLTTLKLLKDNTDRELYDELVQSNTIDGLTVIESTLVDQGQCIVLDTDMVNLYNYVPFSIRFGYENDDIRKNFITVIGESRNMLYFKAEEKKAIVKFDIALTLAALQKP